MSRNVTQVPIDKRGAERRDQRPVSQDHEDAASCRFRTSCTPGRNGSVSRCPKFGLRAAEPALTRNGGAPTCSVATMAAPERAHGLPPQAVVISKMLSLPARTSASWWLVMCHQGYGPFAGLNW
jgi:hypothetical protein